MNRQKQSKKEIHIILFAFIIMVILALISKTVGFYQIETLHKTTSDIYEHPLKISNAAINIKLEAYKIHKNMKDVVLSSSEKELNKHIEEVDKHEKHVYDYLTITEKYIIGKEGLALQKETKNLFSTWKPIRDEVIKLVKNAKINEAVAITKTKGAKHLLKLENSSHKLYLYAQNKALHFQKGANSSFEKLKFINIEISILLLLLFALIVYYTIKRTTNYFNKNEHLTDVLAVVRNVNQLIVREKEVKKLLQNSCNILASSHVYGNVWIITFDEENQIEHIVGSDSSENFTSFKNKIEKNWTPNCIHKTSKTDEVYSYIEDTSQDCHECPLINFYNGKSAFSIKLKYESTLYGYLNISIDNEHINNTNELSLLYELAGDIAYAINNLRLETSLKESNERERENKNNIVQIKELYENIISSVDNLIFVKDTNFNYITCNSAFEKFMGRSKEELIGKNDYDFFEKEIADSFRNHDKKIFMENKTKTEYMWVTYPDGSKVYLLTTISPLINSDKKTFGFVGNSADVTKQQHTLERLKEAQSLAKLGSWEYDIEKNELQATEEIYNIYGVTDFNKKLTKHFLYKNVHPDDLKKTKKHLRESLIFAEGNIFHNRIIRENNGETRYLEHRWSTKYENKIAIKFIGTTQDITEHIKMQTALNESEKKFRLLIEQSPFIIEIYDMNGLQIEVNHAYEVLWNIPAKLTLHKFNVLKSQEVKKTGLIEYVKRAYDGEYVNVPVYEFDPTGKTEAQGKGRKRSLSTKIFPIKDKNNKIENIVIMHEDVTEQEQITKLLEEKKRELETTIQEAPNPIMVHNEDGEVLLINKVWEQLTGYKYSEINTIAKWTQKAYGKQKLVMKECIDNLYNINTKVDNGEYNILTKNKETIIWQFSSAPLGTINGKRTIITSAMDITELKHKDDLIMVQSRHAAMGEMIGMIAHQWRQPISVIAMAANNMLLDIILEDFNAEKAEKISQTILQQTSHLSKTIDDFRNFFKSDKEVSKVKLQNIMEETINIVQDSLKNNHIKLKTSYDSNSEVDAYPRELMQVFVNIINNAKDAILSNAVKKSMIRIKIYDEEEYVNTEICDNAKGIDEDNLQKIFEPYFTTKGEKTGTGLGLYMSKMIIENHLHGSIEAYNDKRGACFRIKLLKS